MLRNIGWEAGIRTPISASRARSPTVERPPSRQAETTIITGRARQPRNPRAHGSLSRLRQRYQHATDRYGRHASPIFRIRSGVGPLRSRYCVRIALTMPSRRPAARRADAAGTSGTSPPTSGRSPSPSSAPRSPLRPAARRSCSRSSRPSSTCADEIAQIADLLPAVARRAQLLVGQRRNPRRRSPAGISAASRP